MLLVYCWCVLKFPDVDLEPYSTPGKILMNYTVYVEISTQLIIQSLNLDFSLCRLIHCSHTVHKITEMVLLKIPVYTTFKRL